ncbi:MAG TPA: SBBP repeat-containing protein [Pirellulales bacterium]|jgi:hypothetical protein|nr:SBBP repeat-containing protein [Pirellulales bacterium]
MSLASRFWKWGTKLASARPNRGYHRRRRQSRRNVPRRSFLIEPLEERTVLSAVTPGAEQAAAYGQIPLSFETNQGQTAAGVNFLSHGNGYALFLTPTEAVLRLQHSAADNPASPRTTQIADPPKADSPLTNVLGMQLIGGNPAATPTDLDPQAGTSNYLIGDNPSQWQTNVAHYGKAEFDGVYPGIDLVYYGNQRQLEYDFVVAAGSNPAAIKLGFQGAGSVTLDAHGDLVLHTSGGDVVEHAPVVYQTVDGVRQVVEGQYVLLPTDHSPLTAHPSPLTSEVGFQVGTYDKSEPLVIDPVLSYSTYLGGNGGDSGNAFAVDSSGDAYITGRTQSANFPGTSGGFGGAQDAFVTKLNASGTAIIYSTYLGGNGYDRAYGIAIDASGDAYVTGLTQSANFPTTNGAFQSQLLGSQDSFLTELNATGTAPVYSTFLGGSSGDYGAAIVVDSAGDAYVTGTTGNSNFPTTANAFQRTSYSGGFGDAFVTEFNPAGSALVYSTILGGTAGDPGYSTTLDTEGQGIALDSSGNVYVTGQTASDTFATTSGAFQTANPKGPYTGGFYGAFVSKINPAKSGSASLVYSTYLAGTGYGESGNGIAVDASGNAYVTGTTASSDFPTANALQPALGASGGYYNAFVTELNAAGSALVYSTFLGGKGNDSGNGIAVDAAGEAFVAGYTQSTNFPTANALQSALGGSQNAFVAKLSAAGSSLVYSTFLGGSGSDSGNGIALDGAGNAYVTGTTSSTNFPTSNPLQSANGGGGDAFVAKIGAAAGFVLSTPSNATAGGTFSITVTATNAGGTTNTGYTGTVHFNSSDGQAVLPANYTFVSGDQGVHTFAGLILKTAGNQTVTAADTASGSITGASGTISVVAAAANKFVFTSSPGSVKAGTAFSVTIEVTDAYGNVVTNYTGTVHFTDTASSATLPKDYTFTAGDQGVHTFTGLVLNKKGTQTITVSDTKHKSIVGSVVESVL